MKKMNNKGFSLVELIIVIAIMAILIAVLAPQYLRYVEKSRLQSDNTTLGEIANAVKVAAANDVINKEIADAADKGVTINVSTEKLENTSGGSTELQKELDNVIGQAQLKSNTYVSGTKPAVIAIMDKTTKQVTVKIQNMVKEVDATAADVTM